MCWALVDFSKFSVWLSVSVWPYSCRQYTDRTYSYSCTRYRLQVQRSTLVSLVRATAEPQSSQTQSLSQHTDHPTDRRSPLHYQGGLHRGVRPVPESPRRKEASVLGAMPLRKCKPSDHFIPDKGVVFQRLRSPSPSPRLLNPGERVEHRKGGIRGVKALRTHGLWQVEAFPR